MSTPTLTRRRVLAGAAALPVATLLAGCGGDSDDTGPRLLQPVAALTSFGHLGRDAYLHAAVDQGLYEGLEVTVEGGTGAGENLALLTGGQVQFVAADIMGMVVAHATNPGGTVLLAAVQQSTIAALMTLRSDITTPLDLHDRKVGTQPGSGVDLLFEPWAAAAGLDLTRVERIPIAPTELVPALIGRQVDAIGQFVVGRPFVEFAAEGREVTVLPFGDLLRDTYGVGLWTTRELAQAQPELCRLWRDGTLAGLQWSIDHPQEAGQILQGLFPETNAEVAARELQLMAPYVTPPEPAAPLGAVDLDRLTRTIGLLESSGAIPPGITPEDLTIPELLLGGPQ
jgi:NitT/TauT family transport system substrate-binding protein